nr:pyridoxal-phosphate dependent enzyme [Jiangella mangrovi]
MAGVAHRTPILTSTAINHLVGAEVYLKCENVQRAGSFKIRGAYNAIAGLDEAPRRRGVVTYSSGNHAQAVALAARLVGTSAVVVMPSDAPTIKRAATEAYGAKVVEYDRYTGDRAAVADEIAAAEGRTLIPPYEHRDVMAGQGTVALELLEDTGPLDALLAPIGGGGLMAGSAVAAAAMCPGIRLIAVEPETGDDTRRSLAAGTRVRIPVPRTIADGIATDTPGELTFPVVQRLVYDIVLVTDDEIRDAMRLAFERLKIVVEPAGAATLAALLAGRVRPLPHRVGVIVSGGNVDAATFARLFGGA